MYIGPFDFEQTAREMGSLRSVKRLVKSLCMVNSTLEFGQHPLVVSPHAIPVMDP